MRLNKQSSQRRSQPFAALVGCGLLLAAFVTEGPLEAGAQSATRLRIATLAPTNTRLGRYHRELNRALLDRTGGRVGVHVYGGGSAGDERLVVRKMRVGQLDGAVLTTTGLGMIVPRTLVLQAPGLIRTYAQLDAVRTELEGELDRLFQEAGFQLVGWGDAGQLRMFSTRRIARPADLRQARPWVWRDSPLMIENMRQAGANGVPLGLPEVYPGLQTGMVDTVAASALTAIVLQWHAHLRTMTQQSGGIIIGAMVLRKETFDALPDEARAFILESGRDTQGELRNATRQLDRDAFRSLSRRLEVVDTDPHRAEWEAVARRTREALVGRLYPEELLRRVEAIVQRTGSR